MSKVIEIYSFDSLTGARSYRSITCEESDVKICTSCRSRFLKTEWAAWRKLCTFNPKRYRSETSATHSCPACCNCAPCYDDHKQLRHLVLPVRHTNRILICPHCCQCTEEHCKCIYCFVCTRPMDPKALDICEADPRCSEEGAIHHGSCPCPYNSALLGTSKLTYVNRPLRFLDGPVAENYRSRRYASIELEAGGLTNSTGYLPLGKSLLKWGCPIVFDGSLRNSPGESATSTRSFEINLTPARGRQFVEQVTEICTIMQQYQAQITHRCGAHVHIDARDYGLREVRNLIRLYARVEPAMFAMLPLDRRRSEYSVPASPALLKLTHKVQGDTLFLDFRARLSTYLYGTPDPTKAARKKGGLHGGSNYGHRRNSLNIHSWFHRGTMEFRHFPGSVDPEELINWTAMLTTLLDFIRQRPESAINQLSGTPATILKEIMAFSPGLYLLDFVEKRLDLLSPDFDDAWRKAALEKNKPDLDQPIPFLTQEHGLRPADRRGFRLRRNRMGHLLYAYRHNHKGHPLDCTPDVCRRVRWPTRRDYVKPERFAPPLADWEAF